MKRVIFAVLCLILSVFAAFSVEKEPLGAVTVRCPAQGMLLELYELDNGGVMLCKSLNQGGQPDLQPIQYALSVKDKEATFGGLKRGKYIICAEITKENSEIDQPVSFEVEIPSEMGNGGLCWMPEVTLERE